MFNLRSTSFARAHPYARISILVGVAALAAALFGATAASAAVTLEASVNPAEAMAAPEITTGIRSDEPVVITRSTIKMPAGWKARNPRAVRPCTQADFQAGNCAENTRIGTVASRAVIGVVDADATGGVHLLESDADNDPVKIGFIVTAHLPGLEFPIPVFDADITLEPDHNAAADRIVVTFNDTPAIPVTTFSITLDGGRKGLIGTGPFNHLNGAQQCGVKTFDGVVTVRGESDSTVSDTVDINRNCDPSVVVDAIRQGRQSPMRPSLWVRSNMRAHSDVTFEVAGAINDGYAGYHTVKNASLYFPVSTRVNLDAVSRCDEDAGADCPAQSKVGDTSMWVAAAGQSHFVRGNVYLTDGGLRMVYTNTPVRLSNRAPIVLNATLQWESMRGWRIMVGDHANADAAGFPTVYEVKRWSLNLDGDAGDDFLTHGKYCDPRIGLNTFRSTFSSDYGLKSHAVMKCNNNDNWQWKPPITLPLPKSSGLGGQKSSELDVGKSGNGNSEGGKSEGSGSSEKAGPATSEAGKTKTVAFTK